MQSSRCISTGFFCDGIKAFNCKDYSDEIFCTCETRPNVVTCPGGSSFTDCIPKVWLCNGYPDCPDATDEQNCDYLQQGKNVLVILTVLVDQMYCNHLMQQGKDVVLIVLVLS